MEGYFLFRGDVLIAGNPDNFSASGLHEQGTTGDILVKLQPRSITTFAWQDQSLFNGIAWGPDNRETSDRYRVLILLQQ